jgi:hypothetical protein
MIGAVDLRRIAHWVIGLGVTGVLVVDLVFHLVAAGMIAAADPRSRAAEQAAGYTARAGSTVLDVDAEHGRRGVGYVVDVSYRAKGQNVVTTVDWTDDRPPPAVGDTVDVAFDPVTPENAVAADLDARGVRDWSVRRHLVWGGADVVLAVLVLGAALRWAPRRKPAATSAWGPEPPASPGGRPPH